MATALAEQLRQTSSNLASLIKDVEKARTQTPQEEILRRHIFLQLLTAKIALDKKVPEVSRKTQPLTKNPPKISIDGFTSSANPVLVSEKQKPETKNTPAIEPQNADMALLLSVFEGRTDLIPPDEEDRLYLSMVAKIRIAMVNGNPQEVQEAKRLFAEIFAEEGQALRERLKEQLLTIYGATPLPNQPPPTTGLVRGEIAIGEVWDLLHPHQQ